MTTTTPQRHTAEHPCPVCGGHEDLPRGHDQRCFGFDGFDGWVHCTREEHAGNARFHPRSQTWSHRSSGKCPCGVEHVPGPERSGHAKTNGHPEIVATYLYRDESGSVLYRVTRTSPKDFFQNPPDGNGGWRTGKGCMKGVRLVPYRLPELIASDAGVIVIVEGEKDVDRLRAEGFKATCNVGGAGKWRDEYSDHLADRHVVILPDNDKPGRDHAELVARSVAPVAASVKVVELPELPDHGDVSDWFDVGETAESLRAIIDATPPWSAPPVDQLNDNQAGTGADDRPAIEVTTRRDIVLAETLPTLARDPGLYQRGGSLVSITSEAKDAVPLTGRTLLNQVLGTPKVITLSEATIGCRLTRCASFFEVKRDKAGEEIAVDCHPPNWLIRAIAATKEYPGVRPLVAVSECPFPRPDGTIVDTPGYDPATGIMYRPSIDFPPIPAEPTRDDAIAAAERLREPVRQFPFETENDWAVYLSALLTEVARPAIPGPVPGVALIGNKAGSGKGILIDTIGLTAYGRCVPSTAYPRDSVEADKVKIALALSGQRTVHFDNLDEGSSYGNSALDSALTSDSVNGRILGTPSLTGELPLRLTWFLSGNNITPTKDAYRRWLPCRLVTPLEYPEERDDIHIKDLRTYIRESRPNRIGDVLTILKAHALAGHPNGGWPLLGSYEAWDRCVRGATWFATGLDCCATRLEVAADSDSRRAKVALLEGWLELPGGDTGITVKQALRLLAEGSESDFPTMRDALSSLERSGKPIDGQSLGKILRGMKDSFIAGLCFRLAGEKHRAKLWRVTRSDSTPPNSKPSGEDDEDERGCFTPSAEDFRSHNYLNTCGDTSTRTETGQNILVHPRHPHRLHDSPPVTRRSEVVGRVTAWGTRVITLDPTAPPLEAFGASC